MNIPRLGLFLVSALLGAACHGESRALDTPLDPMTPVGIDDHVVIVDRGSSTALIMNVSQATDGPPTVVPVVTNPVLAAPRSGHSDQLLVLSSGQIDDGIHAPERAGLVVVPATGKTTEYRFDNSYTALSQSDDGRFAILYFDPNQSMASGGVLSISDEVTVVDLNANPASSNPVTRTLRSFGSSPQSVAFGTMTLNGTPRHLAVVLFDSDVAILDLESGKPEFTIQLERQNTPGFHLEQTLFSSDAHRIYLRATGSNDIYVITLAETTPTDPKLNDFTPSVNPIGAGTGPADMALYTATDGTPGTPETRLLVASPGSSEAIIIEPDSGTSVSIPLPTPASQILPFDLPKPGDPTSAPRALFYSSGTTTLEFVDLVGIESRGALNVESLTTEAPYARALSFHASTGGTPDTLMLIHQDTGLSQLNLAERTLTEIQGPNLAGAVADPASNKLWVKADDRVGFLDLGPPALAEPIDAGGVPSSDIHPGEVRVDATVQDLVTVPPNGQDATQHAHLFVTYQNPLGWATVLDATNPTNSAAEFSIRGYLLGGALARGAK